MGETANIIGLAEIFDNEKNRLTDDMNVADDAPEEGIILRLSETLLRHGPKGLKNQAIEKIDQFSREG
jgi:hypothetical protein